MPRFLFVVLVVAANLPGCSCGGSSKHNPDAEVDAPPDGQGQIEVLCEMLPASQNTCDVTAGGTAKLLKGNVLTPTTMYRGGQVLVDDMGKIACVGCNCAAGGETVITCPDAAISPGLINTHDHITFTQNPPYKDTGERYEDRQQWRKGQDGHTKISSSGGASADQIRWGELRFLMGGATSIVGSGGQVGLLRNLDSANQEGLGKKAVNFDTFPLDDSGGTKRTGDCNYGGTPTTATSIAANDAYEPHTSEGIDSTARNEFLCESSDSFDTMTPGVSNNLVLGKTAMIHAIGLTAPDYGAMAAAGTSLIWSPRSNITLYGDTARVSEARRLGVNIALGTDWMPTGSMNLLRELACADSFNQTYLDHFFSDADLWMMVTSNAAAATHMDDAIGVLAKDHVADIAIFKGHGKTYRAVLEAKPDDVALVLRGGTALYGDDAVVMALAQNCDTVDVCGTGKRVCTMSEVGKTFSALQTAAGASIYPAFACGEPMNEPSCSPKRAMSVAGSTVYTGMSTADDSDGDGVPDAMDNCPHVFNPARPMDMGMQPDADGDGDGDACDPCPLDANTTSCSQVDPNDRDHDGVPNATDNCPDTANPDQMDTDNDGKGDACDACPNDANPGTAGCPATIYQIKMGALPNSTPVRVTNALVTGKGTNGFFVQVKEGDAGYTGPDFSGLFVFTGAGGVLANATVGARVTIDGSIATFQGEIELATVTAVTVTAAGPEPLPAPISATYAEVKTGGTRAAALEGVIVMLGASQVTANAAATNEYTLTAGADSLVAGSFLFTPTPLPGVGQNFISVTGVLAMRQMASKIEPRNAADLVLGAPGLASFGPASFLRVGQVNAPTFPTPLTVTLTGPAQTNTTVVLMSGDQTALTVTNVTVPAGQTSATVSASALVQNADVPVMATLGVQSMTAHVRVLGVTETPSTVTLSPLAATIHPGDMTTLTVSLDIPTAAATTVTLAANPANGGTLPASVTIGANQIATTFTFADTATTGTIAITATFGASTSTANLTVASASTHLVISQVYGGGGNTGAPFTNDFVELHNATSTAVNLAGMSVQYASAAGTSWQVTPLPAIDVPAGGYVLIGEAGGTTGTALPAPDATGTINMSASSGKVALVMGTTALTGSCPTGMVDLVGYGTANCSQTSPAPAASTTTAATRGMNGCASTNNNMADFTSVAPMPRNSATTPLLCN